MRGFLFSSLCLLLLFVPATLSFSEAISLNPAFTTSQAWPNLNADIAFPQETYVIPLHVIPLADDDGISRATTVTPAQICENIKNANPVYASAGIQFVFNQATDWTPLNNTQLNNLSRDGKEWWIEHNKKAKEYRGKIVIFLGRPGSNAFAFPPDISDTAPNWTVPSSQPLPAENIDYVGYYNQKENVAPNLNISTFPHELGHYLGLFHTHPSWGNVSVNAAKALVQANGADGLDGDQLQDTPPDPGTASLDDVYGKANRCSSAGTVTIEGIVFQPNRNNIMSYFGCPPYELSAEQIKRIQDTLRDPSRNHLIVGPVWRSDWSLGNRNFCRTSGEKLYVGDFDGDNRSDLLCNSTNGAMHVDLANSKGEFWKSDWSLGNRNFCRTSGEKLYVGDFNGDNRSDLLCNSTNGAMHVDLANSKGEFWKSDWSLGNRNFCRTSGEKLYVGDFNGDGNDDLLCNSTSGAMHVDLANSNGEFWKSDWSLGNRNFCRTSGEKLYVGDFNGDGRDDLLCNSTNGAMHVNLANNKGEFWKSDWFLGNRNFCRTSGEKLYVGDFNGDGYDDLLCNSTDGTMQIDLANSKGEFWKSDWIYPERNFCRTSGEELHVQDFDGDNRSDLLCNSTNGAVHVDLMKTRDPGVACITSP